VAGAEWDGRAKDGKAETREICVKSEDDRLRPFDGAAGGGK
jgi:hypothetical protein